MPKKQIYDGIAKEYCDTNKLMFRDAMEAYTMLQLLGDLSGFHVIDFAFGEGFCMRLIKQLGA